MAPIRTSLARSVGKLLGVYGTKDLSIRGYDFYQSNQFRTNVTGGTIYQNGTYRVHEFLTPGTLEVNSGTLSNVRYLVVGGGGGGGGFDSRAGGGGAGGLRSNHPDMPSPLITPSSYTLTPGVYPVVVGEGGHARLDPNGSWPNTNNQSEGGYPTGVPAAFGTPGYSSIFNGAEVNSVNKIVGTGGGAGIWGGSGLSATEGTGGSGGGCGDWDSGGTGAQSVVSPDGISPTAQGYLGGPSPTGPGSYQSGGGGGAGGAGVPSGGKGGPSLQIGIRGKNTTPVGEYYAGGGQGTGGAIPATSISDPGGSGGRYTEGHPIDPVGDLPARTHESNGYPGTGGGGAGVNHSPNRGRGGPGIIIISYQL